MDTVENTQKHDPTSLTVEGEEDLTGIGKSSEKIRGEVSLGAGKWIEIKEITYAYGFDEEGKEKHKTWELVARKTRPKTSKVDGCQMMGILKDGDRKHLII